MFNKILYFQNLRKAAFILLGLICILISVLAAPKVSAQGMIELGEHNLNYLFADHLLFTASFRSGSPFSEGHIIVQVQDEDQIQSFQAALSNEGEFIVEISLNENFQPKAFSEINYWYLVGTEDGNIFESPAMSLYYADNRFEWKSVESDHFEVFWHNGEASFGAAVLQTAEESIASTQKILPIAGPEKAIIYVYDDAADLQMLMNLAGYTWTAGHSDLRAGNLFVSIAPTPQQSLEIERQIPHEIAHLMLFQAVGEGSYARIPFWLREGIASNAELYSDPIRNELLALAFAEGSIPSLVSLCERFPFDANMARVAYAEAASFISYLNSEYRVVGIGALVDSYARNENCVGGPTELFGKDLYELENEWQISKFEKKQPMLEMLNQMKLPGITFLILAMLALIWIRRWRRKSDGK